MINTPSRFIVIDDDKVNNLLANLVIKTVASQSEILTFNIPEKGFEYIKNEYSGKEIETPTVLFLDINMPTWSGWDFLDHFDQLDEKIKKQIDIYMLSSSVDLNDKARAYNNPNVKDYVEKPLTREIVTGIITIKYSKGGQNPQGDTRPGYYLG